MSLSREHFSHISGTNLTTSVCANELLSRFRSEFLPGHNVWFSCAADSNPRGLVSFPIADQNAEFLKVDILRVEVENLEAS
jgi:hypothetical protein